MIEDDDDYSILAYYDAIMRKRRETNSITIKPITMSEVKEKKVRTPRNYENILKGALSLPIGDRVNLVKEVSDFNKKEADQKKLDADNWAALINGTQ